MVVISTVGPEVVVVNNPVVVVIETSVTEVVCVIVVVIDSSVGFNVAVVVPSVTVLFLIASSSIIVVTIVMIIIEMLKTAQNFCPVSKYFQKPNIVRPDKLTLPLKKTNCLEQRKLFCYTQCFEHNKCIRLG